MTCPLRDCKFPATRSFEGIFKCLVGRLDLVTFKSGLDLKFCFSELLASRFLNGLFPI